MWEQAHVGFGGTRQKRKGPCTKQCAWRKHGSGHTRLAEACPPRLRNIAKLRAEEMRPKWPFWKHRAPKMRLVEAQCARRKHCYPEIPLESHPISRGSQWSLCASKQRRDCGHISKANRAPHAQHINFRHSHPPRQVVPKCPFGIPRVNFLEFLGSAFCLCIALFANRKKPEFPGISQHLFGKGFCQQFTYGVVSEGVFAESCAEILRKMCGNLQKYVLSLQESVQKFCGKFVETAGNVLQRPLLEQPHK